MYSIHHLNAATEILSSQITAEAKRTTHKATTKEQLVQSHTKRDEVLGLLDNAIAQVAKASGTVPRDAESSIPLGDRLSQFSVSGGTQRFMSTNAGSTLLGEPSAGTPQDAARELADQVSGVKAPQMKTQNTQLAQMADSAKPIMDSFTRILEKPYLGNYSATLNTAPVVGLKGRTIWYIDTKADPSFSWTATKDIWSVFSDIPILADLNLGNVHLFPYQGDMYLAVGKSVWFKQHRDREDPQVKQEALRKWPKLFHDDWTLVGSDCLPASDLLDVIPHARLSADHSAMRFRLLALASDGSLKVFSGDELSKSNKFDDLLFDQGTDAGIALPRWARIAYHNDLVIGYDDKDNTWNIMPDFDKSSYSISNRSHEQHFTEFTATDVGLVVAKEDGFLYKRLVESVANPEKPDETTTTWIRWINQDGVKALGVASPGVMLDLRSLTQSLRTRYMDTQASLWPIVNQIHAWGMTHEIYMQRVKDAADQFNNADTIMKEKVALKTGKESVKHGQVWAKLLGKTCANAHESVALMSKQLTEVNTDLHVQLRLLHDKLVKLKGQLAVQKDALSKAMVGFWIGIATTLIGLIGVVAGIAIGNPWVMAGAGALFVGGIITTATYGNKASQARAAIDHLNIEINDATQAHEEMSQLIVHFDSINGLYGNLLTFWGRMRGNADKVGVLDSAILIEIGQKILESDAAEIEASLQLTTDMQSAAQAYMDLIASQGIKIPVTPDEDDDDDENPSEAKSNEVVLQAQSTGIADKKQSFAGAEDPGRAVVRPLYTSEARKALANGDFAMYDTHMQKLEFENRSIIAAEQQASLQTSAWMNIEELKANANLFNSSELQRAMSSLRLAGEQSIAAASRSVGVLIQTKISLFAMAKNTVDLARIMSQWQELEVDAKTEEQRERQVAKFQPDAVRFCSLCRDTVGEVNNALVGFNHAVQDYHESLGLEVNMFRERISGEMTAMRSELDGLRDNIPWTVKYLGGPAALMLWLGDQTSQIRGKHEGKVQELQVTISQLQEAQKSGLTFRQHAVTWLDMAQTMSRRLGDVYSTLTTMKGALIESPVVYHQLLNNNWKELGSSASGILSMLGLEHEAQDQQTTTINAIAPKTKDGPIPAARTTKIPNQMPEDIKLRLIAALTPSDQLSVSLKTNAEHSALFYSKIQALFELPYTREINASGTVNQPLSLLDVCLNSRREFAVLAANSFDTISRIQTLALVEGLRARHFAAGKASTSMLVKSSIVVSADVVESVQRTASMFEARIAKFSGTFASFDAIFAAFNARMNEIDSAVAQGEKQLQDYIKAQVTDALAITFVSATIAISLIYGTDGLKQVGEKTTQAMELAGVDKKTIFQTIYKDLDLNKVQTSISKLKSLKVVISTATAKLAEVKDAFMSSLTQMKAMGDVVLAMYARLIDVTGVDGLQKVKLVEGDVTRIEKAWGEVGEACEAWLTEFNKQGISPVLYSYDTQDGDLKDSKGVDMVGM